MPIAVEELEALRAEARRLAEEAGLDPFPVVFGVLDYDEINEIAAYEGFPVRYPHWRFGMGYDIQRKRSAYQGAWIFELVINADPALAYLRASNSRVEHKAVMVHVYAHADFFKHNRWFAHTPRDALRMMDQHARRIEDYRNRFGVERVEAFMDRIFSIQFNVDPHGPFLREPRPAEADEAEPAVPKLPVKRPYMERFINPPAWVEKRAHERRSARERERARRLEASELARPSKDLLGFLLAHARLEDWQLDIISMLREEALYFVPQIQTKVMNEGWAAYWQSELMKRFATPEEFLDHAEMQSLVLGGGGALNPYKLGKLVWEDIKERWDKGRFGREWERCTDAEALARWDTGAGLGLEKMFEVRRTHNDLTFLSEFLTESVFKKLGLFSYEYVPETEHYHLTSKEFETVKRKLLLQFTNLGRPTIKVATGNHDNRGELLLVHEWNGIPLELDEAKAVLKNLYHLWRRPVNLKTIVLRKGREANPLRQRVRPELPQTAVWEEQGLLVRFDGERFRELALGDKEVADLRVEGENYRTLPQEWMG